MAGWAVRDRVPSYILVVMYEMHCPIHPLYPNTEVLGMCRDWGVLCNLDRGESKIYFIHTYEYGDIGDSRISRNSFEDEFIWR